jgi:hypothetical protein
MGRTQGVRGAPRWADDLLIKIPQQGGSIVEEAQLVDQLGGLNTVALSWGQAVWATPCPGESPAPYAKEPVVAIIKKKLGGGVHPAFNLQQIIDVLTYEGVGPEPAHYNAVRGMADNDPVTQSEQQVMMTSFAPPCSLHTVY